MSTPTSNTRLDWRLLARYLRPHRFQVLVLGAVLAGTIAVQLATPLAAARFLDEATSGGAFRTLLGVALLTMVLAVLGQGLALLETWVAERVAWGATNALREDLAAHLLNLDASFHNAHTPGELIERVDGDIGTLARFFSRFAVYVLGNAVLIVGVLALLYAVDWRIGLGLTLFVATALAAVLRQRVHATPYSARERQAGADAYGFLGEYLSGLEDVRSSDAKAFVLRRWTELMRTWLAARMGAQMRGYGMVSTVTLVFGLGIAFALMLSAMLYRDGTLTVGTVFLVFRYTEMLRQPTEQIRNEVQDLQQAGASLGRVEVLFARQSKLGDGPGDRLPEGPLSIDLEHVSFGYGLGTPVLRGVSLHVPAGRVLGVLGRTGSGKTTMTRLLPRFHDPVEGMVRLGGVDLRTVSVAAVRARVGLLTQEAHLFNASLRDNLTLFDAHAPDHCLIDVLDSVGMGRWLGGLPDGLDTVLGAAGSGLSAGQIQLLACARLLLRQPDVVILDEPSSKLDPATERLVHQALARLLAGRTGIVVAHRLSTFDLVDDILVLDGGETLEHGSRSDLIADDASRFATLLRHDQGGVFV